MLSISYIPLWRIILVQNSVDDIKDGKKNNVIDNEPLMMVQNIDKITNIYVRDLETNSTRNTNHRSLNSEIM